MIRFGASAPFLPHGAHLQSTQHSLGRGRDRPVVRCPSEWNEGRRAGCGERLGRDAGLRARWDGHAADLAVFVVQRYGDELTAVITHTIDRWDGKEAARKIELHVGRDLQFIRINGTIVGGLVGVVIHAVTLVV